MLQERQIRIHKVLAACRSYLILILATVGRLDDDPVSLIPNAVGICPCRQISTETHLQPMQQSCNCGLSVLKTTTKGYNNSPIFMLKSTCHKRALKGAGREGPLLDIGWPDRPIEGIVACSPLKCLQFVHISIMNYCMRCQHVSRPRWNGPTTESESPSLNCIDFITEFSSKDNWVVSKCTHLQRRWGLLLLLMIIKIEDRWNTEQAKCFWL